MRDECVHYFQDEERYKCAKGHRCHWAFHEPCADFEDYATMRKRLEAKHEDEHRND